MAKNGIMLFYDNESVFRILDGDSVKTLILDLFAYSKDGTKPPKYEDSGLNVALAMLMASEDRGKAISESRSISGRVGGKATASKPKQIQANASKSKQTQANIIDNNIIDHNITHSPLTPREGGAGESEQESGFAQFWDAYPRKESRERAFAEWDSLSPNAELRGRMLDALDTQARSAEWQREGGRYIPHAAKWLKEHRWEDVDAKKIGGGQGSFDTEDFFAAAVAKSYHEPSGA